MTKFTIGADPEFILRKNGKPVSSEKYIEGTADNPTQLGGNHYAHKDNVLVELTVPKSYSRIEFSNTMQTGMNLLTKYIASKDKDLRISKVPTALYPKHVMDTELAKVVGCSPDYDAWSCEENIVPPLADTMVRSAGGHVHVGWDWKTDEERLLMARILDCTLGSPLAYQDGRYGEKRRRLYGRMGAHRPKPYGIEYRVLSNMWCIKGQYYAVYNGVLRAMQIMPYAELFLNTALPNLKTEVEKSINKCSSAASHNVNTAVHTFITRTLPKLGVR